MSKLAKFKTRLKMCALARVRPWQVKDFWEGIEELKRKYCLGCGKKLSQRTAQIAKKLGANVLCKRCNPHPISPF